MTIHNNSLTVGEIAEFVNGRIVGDEKIEIFNLNGISEATAGEMTFYSDSKYEKFLETTTASCILVPEGITAEPKANQSFIVVEKPYISFVKFINFLDARKVRKTSYIHPTAVIDESAKIAESAYIGPYCVVGKNSSIGEKTILISNVNIYDNVRIGDNCLIHAATSFCCDTVVGNSCLILPGAVIGSDGFGFIENSDGSYTKIPQIGNVIIGNNVEIGANSTIDRAMIGSTVISDGVKIDNLVQIAHNCKIGENTAMASQVGISGSARIGKRNKLGGQVGVAGHLEMVDDVTLYARSGVAKGITEKGIYFGAPARPRLRAFKIEAAIHTLPDLVKTVNDLKEELARLKSEM